MNSKKQYTPTYFAIATIPKVFKKFAVAAIYAFQNATV